MITDNAIDTVCCTDLCFTSQVAEQEGLDLPNACVSCLIVAGEPGGSLPAAPTHRVRMGAKLFDHHGMTEVGPVTYQDNDRRMPAYRG